MGQSSAIGHAPLGGPAPSGRCSALKADGSRCKGIPQRGSEWCFAHHPDNRQKHSANGRLGGRLAGRGRSRSTARELSETRRELKEIIGLVRDGKLARDVSTALFQGYSVLLKAVEVERKVEEVAELRREVEEIKAHDRQHFGGGSRY